MERIPVFQHHLYLLIYNITELGSWDLKMQSLFLCFRLINVTFPPQLYIALNCLHANMLTKDGEHSAFLRFWMRSSPVLKFIDSTGSNILELMKCTSVACLKHIKRFRKFRVVY